jgi:hypothetical protein
MMYVLEILGEGAGVEEVWKEIACAIKSREFRDLRLMGWLNWSCVERVGGDEYIDEILAKDIADGQG